MDKNVLAKSTGTESCETSYPEVVSASVAVLTKQFHRIKCFR